MAIADWQKCYKNAVGKVLIAKHMTTALGQLFSNWTALLVDVCQYKQKPRKALCMFSK